MPLALRDDVHPRVSSLLPTFGHFILTLYPGGRKPSLNLQVTKGASGKDMVSHGQVRNLRQKVGQGQGREGELVLYILAIVSP